MHVIAPSQEVIAETYKVRGSNIKIMTRIALPLAVQKINAFITQIVRPERQDR